MERYTPGDASYVTNFMARRTLGSHGAFFRPFLWPGARVLDCGCGPGTITIGLAGCVAPGGSVQAIDANPAQVEIARRTLQGVAEVECRVASIYELPFDDDYFDVVFSHALFEHLAEPERAARELFRVLKPGGVAGLRSPDFSGKLVGPPNEQVDRALQYYEELQASNGGNLCIGRWLGTILASAGFSRVQTTASFDCYAPTSLIGEYLARQIEISSEKSSVADFAKALRDWHTSPDAFFAQAWCEVVGQLPWGGSQRQTEGA